MITLRDFGLNHNYLIEISKRINNEEFIFLVFDYISLTENSVKPLIKWLVINFDLYCKILKYSDKAEYDLLSEAKNNQELIDNFVDKFYPFFKNEQDGE